MVDRHRQETSTAQVGGEALGQKPQRKNHPKAVESHTVGQRRLRGVAHSQHDGSEPFEYGHSDSGENVEQEKVHQEKEEPAPERHVARIDPDEEAVENRIEQSAVRPGQMLRHEQRHLKMPEDNQHKPAEGDRGMNVAQKRLALPDLRVEKAVAEQILDVLQGYLRINQRLPEESSVLRGDHRQKPEKSHRQPDQHEADADHERNHEVAVARRNPVDDLRSGMKGQ